MRVLSVVTLVVVCAGACGGKERAVTARYASNEPASLAAGRQPAYMDSTTVDPHSAAVSRAPDSTIAPSMIIRTGEASIQVESIDSGIARVQQLAARLGGFIANSTVQTGPDRVHSATLEMKLPASRWNQAITGLTPVGKLESVTQTAQDVGEEFVDASARMANARRFEQRLLELLSTRTGKLQDVIELERELARVREEIERYDGRVRYLRARSAVSTLSVTVHEKLPIIGERGSTGVIGASFRQSWANFVEFTAGLIAALGWLVPLLALLFAAILVGRRFGLFPGLSWRRNHADPGAKGSGPS